MKRLPFFALLLATASAFSQTPINWSASLDVAAASFANQHPRLALGAAGQPFVVWGRVNADRAYFARGLATGGFAAPIVLNPAGVPAFTQSWAGPDLAAHGDTVYAVFKKKPEDVSHAYLVYSYDGGVTFSQPVRLDDLDAGLSRFPTITTDDQGQPVAAYMQFDNGFSNARYVVVRSGDYGMTFDPAVLASGFSGGHVCDCCPASLVASADRVAMLYRDNLNNIRNTWAGISTDGGASFPTGLAVDEYEWFLGGCPSNGPDGVIIGDTLYAVFMNGIGGGERCFLSRTPLPDGPATPNEPLLTGADPDEPQNYPRIASAGTALAIALVHGTGNARQAGLLFSEDIGNGAPLQYQSLATGAIENVDVAVGAGMVHVVWQDNSTGTVRYRAGTFSATTAAPVALVQGAAVVFPSPVSGERAAVKLPAAFDGALRYRIIGPAGSAGAATFAYATGGRFEIPVAQLRPGLYLLRVETNGGSFVVTFIKQ